MNNDLSLLDLIIGASVPVQLVMLLLLGASVASWVIIFRKRQVLSRARKMADAFEERFWSGVDLAALFGEISKREGEIGALENVFEAGFREFARLRQRRNIDSNTMLDGAQRAMRVALNREMDRLENHLSFLATVGSTSPYVGLFGTVWGIMLSFHALASVSQATIAMVAPGISEALIATAMGLFAAIPAVIAYNKFSNEVERLEGRYQTFQEEFATILQRQAHLDD
ncbi:MAG: protein TolQ [Lysobacteraceae bacterium]|nr:MAG: protein TolQ [Xanthomonadaceae bacterium]